MDIFLLQPDCSGQNMERRILEQDKKIAELGKKISEQEEKMTEIVKKISEQEEKIEEILRNMELIQSVVTANRPGSKALLEGNTVNIVKSSLLSIPFIQYDHHENIRYILYAYLYLAYAYLYHASLFQQAPGQPFFRHGRLQRQLQAFRHRNLPKIQQLFSALPSNG